jgi:phosphatidylinositol phospholipase C delta
LATDLGNLDLRETVWERQYWKAADKEEDHKLDFNNVKALSKRLNVSLTTSQLKQMFQVSVYIYVP